MRSLLATTAVTHAPCKFRRGREAPAGAADAAHAMHAEHAAPPPTRGRQAGRENDRESARQREDRWPGKLDGVQESVEVLPECTGLKAKLQRRRAERLRSLGRGERCSGGAPRACAVDWAWGEPVEVLIEDGVSDPSEMPSSDFASERRGALREDGDEWGRGGLASRSSQRSQATGTTAASDFSQASVASRGSQRSQVSWTSATGEWGSEPSQASCAPSQTGVDYGRAGLASRGSQRPHVSWASASAAQPPRPLSRSTRRAEPPRADDDARAGHVPQAAWPQAAKSEGEGKPPSSMAPDMPRESAFSEDAPEASAARNPWRCPGGVSRIWKAREKKDHPPRPGRSRVQAKPTSAEEPPRGSGEQADAGPSAAPSKLPLWTAFTQRVEGVSGTTTASAGATCSSAGAAPAVLDVAARAALLLAPATLQMQQTRGLPLPERKHIFRELQRQLHPDKNSEDAEMAKLAFQRLMEHRPAYLAGT